MDKLKTITARFYTNARGKSPVLEWLRGLDDADKKAIGKDIARCEFEWPVGPPTVKPLKEGLFEIRTDLVGSRIARVFFGIGGGIMLLVHGIIKKTRKTPIQDIDLARKRLRAARGSLETGAVNE